MLRKLIELRSQKGSLMVEAIAMLGLISMVTPIIYKKAAERTNEVQDINAASEVRTIVNGIDAYLKDNYSTITGGGKVSSLSATSDKEVDYGAFGFNSPTTDTSTKSTTPINIEHFRDYLPLGFRAKGKMFDDFKVVIKQTKDPTGERKALTTVLVAEPTADNPNFSRLRTARIASMIGTNGGYIDGDKATGVQGVWEIPKNEIMSGEGSSNLKDGTIVATSIEPVAEGGGGSPKDVLYRVEVPNHPEYNVMETTLSMGSNPIDQIVDLIAAGEDKTINIKAEGDTDDTGTNATLKVAGKSIINDTLTAAGENFVVESGYVQHKQNLYIGGGEDGADAPFAVSGANGAIQGLGGKFNVNLEGELPYIKLSGKDDSLTVMNANEGKVSFMNQNVAIDPSGNTDIAGYTHVKGDFSAAADNFTVDTQGNTKIAGNTNIYGDTKISGNFSAVRNAIIVDPNKAHIYDTLNIDLPRRRVEIGTIRKPAHLRVYGDTTINNLNVENTFRAGSNNGNYSLYADGNETTVRLHNDSNSFNVLDSNNKKQISVTPRSTIISANGLPAIMVNEANSKALTSFNGDVAFGDDISNFLTISSTNDDGKNIPGSRGDIHMRRGIIELNRGKNPTTSEPIGYIRADRLVSNMASDKSIDMTSGSYDTFQVNPAYTSMMNDIKLASRGGARLSDILPDFVNKGIYVLDNTYHQDNPNSGNWENDNLSFEKDNNGNTAIVVSGLKECESDNTKCDTSPWLGFIPTPNCPPNYVKVATITPIRFAMAQAGIPVSSDGADITPTNDKLPNTIAQNLDPRLGNVYIKDPNMSEEYLYTGTFVEVGDNPTENPWKYKEGKQSLRTPKYWANVINQPYTFQINTWLSTSLKASYPGGKFKGWHGIMGFIYPYLTYKDYITKAGLTPDKVVNEDTAVLWNLFPVYKGELSAIATIYCYFDREAVKGPYVDSYLPHKAESLGEIRDTEKPNYGNGKEIFYDDPNLNYNAPW